jgi:CO dehydrogenase/acetyl-CoA synthase beta subunit
MSIKRKEAKLLGYTLLYDRTGRLITERTSTDITELKKFLTKEEYNTLNTVVRETTGKLDKIHKYLEDYLNSRIMTQK